MITHDLSTAAHLADKIAVMYLGRIVEVGTSRQVDTDPRCPVAVERCRTLDPPLRVPSAAAAGHQAGCHLA